MTSFIIQLIGAYVGSASAALCVESPKHLLYKVGIVGSAGYAVYLVFLPIFNSIGATLIAGIVIAILSQIFARIFKAPVTLFYIPGFFPLVPGIGIYRTSFYYINRDMEQASYYLLETLLIADSIALSIFIVDSLLEIYSHLRGKKKGTSHG